MKWRFYAFMVWVAVTFVLGLIAFADYLFGSSTARQLWLRLVLIAFWPLAMLNSTGREILFKEGTKV